MDGKKIAVETSRRRTSIMILIKIKFDTGNKVVTKFISQYSLKLYPCLSLRINTGFYTNPSDFLNFLCYLPCSGSPHY